MSTLISKWTQALLSLFYPKICISCQAHLSTQEELICLACELHLPKTMYAQYAENPVEKLFWGRAKVKAAASIYYFNKGDGIQKMMHQLKYKNRKDVGRWFGKILALELLHSERFKDIDWIVPIPLHPKKEHLRGFNQSLMIAEGMEEEDGWKVVNALKRMENTASQTRKNKYERWLNVGRSFEVNPRHDLKDKNILLLDDVITTGATLEACIQVLERAGAKSVSVATVACA